jgi:hypothetical protein
MDDNILFRLFDHAWVLLMAVIGFVVRNIHADVEDLKDSNGECELNLEKFKTHVSENYSKEVNTQISLARIHERIDKVGDMLEDKTNEIIKAILQERK